MDQATFNEKKRVLQVEDGAETYSPRRGILAAESFTAYATAISGFGSAVSYLPKTLMTECIRISPSGIQSEIVTFTGSETEFIHGVTPEKGCMFSVANGYLFISKGGSVEFVYYMG